MRPKAAVAAVAAATPPHGGDAVQQRAEDGAVEAGQGALTERGADGLHEALRGVAALGVDVPAVDGARVAAGLLVHPGQDRADRGAELTEYGESW